MKDDIQQERILAGDTDTMSSLIQRADARRNRVTAETAEALSPPVVDLPCEDFAQALPRQF